MQIERQVVGAVVSGDSIQLSAHTGKKLDVEGTAVQARWGETGLWQTFSIESFGGGAIFSGDAVFLKAHTGKLVDVQDVEVQARWEDRGTWQTLHIEKKEGSGAVMPGDTIFLRAHTNKMVEVDGVAVQARWGETGLWQSLVIQKAAPRRLSKSATDDAAALGAFAGVAVMVLVVGMLGFVLVVKSLRLRQGNEVNMVHKHFPYKVQPSQDEADADFAE